MQIEPQEPLYQIMVARYYSSSLGRFMAVDPGDDTALEDPQSWNKYAYVRGNPVRFRDPDGRIVIADDVAVALAFAATVTAAYLVSPSPGDPSKTNAQALGESINDAGIALAGLLTLLRGGKTGVKDSEFENEPIEKLEAMLEAAKKAGDTELVRRLIRTLKGKKARNTQKRDGRGFDFLPPPPPELERKEIGPRTEPKRRLEAFPLPVEPKVIITCSCPKCC